MAHAPAAPASRRRIRPQHVAAALLFLAAVAVFSPVRHHQFISFDDDSYVYRNAIVAQGLTGAGLRWAFTTVHAANWHPLTWLSHMLDAQLFGLSPGGHHLTSALIHALNAALLFWALWRMTAALGRSAAVAAVFGLHPLRVESVAWVAERKDVLGGLFWMLTLLAYVRWTRLPLPGRLAAVAAVFALGLLSKPMLVTLPFVLLLLDYWPLGRLRLPLRGRADAPAPPGVPLTRLLLEKAPLLLLAAASSAVTVAAQGDGAIRSLERYTLGIRAANAVYSYAAYLGKTLWPTDLLIFYPHPGPTLDPRLVLASALALTAATVVVVLRARSLPFLLTGWLWFLGALVPVIGLVQVGAQARADRYTYLPLIGVSISVVWGLPALLPAWRRRAAVLAAGTAVLCLLFSALTVRHVGTMRDDETLYRSMLRVDPANDLALTKLGALLTEQGRVEEGGALMQRAFRRNPLQRARVHLQMAERLSAEGRAGEALLHYDQVLELDPANAVALRAVERLSGERGRATRDAPSFSAGGETVRDQEADSWLRQGNALAAAGHFERAVDYYGRAVELKPELADAWNNLGSALGMLGRHREAAEAFEKAAAAAPGDARARLNLERARRSLPR